LQVPSEFGAYKEEEWESESVGVQLRGRSEVQTNQPTNEWFKSFSWFQSHSKTLCSKTDKYQNIKDENLQITKFKKKQIKNIMYQK